MAWALLSAYKQHSPTKHETRLEITVPHAGLSEPGGLGFGALGFQEKQVVSLHVSSFSIVGSGPICNPLSRQVSLLRTAVP